MASERGCALVTGAARGIGAATARALAEAGWPVGINYRTDADGAGAVAAAIEDAGGRAASIGADVSDPKAIDGLFAEVEGRFGAPVLVLVNNAGVRADGLSPQLADDDWQRVIETNLSAAFRATRRALALAEQEGRIADGALVLVAAFGAGLAWGATLIEWGMGDG